MCGARCPQRSQKAYEPFKLELWISVGHYVGAKKHHGGPLEEQYTLNH